MWLKVLDLLFPKARSGIHPDPKTLWLKPLVHRAGILPVEAKNCQWASPDQQSRNRRYCKYVTWNGKTQTIVEWAEELGMPSNTLVWRFRRGWSTERALTEKHTPRGCRS